LSQPRLPKHFHTSKNLRLFYLPSEPSGIRISIAKKNFKLAVDRNKIKRQIKDIYRKNNLLDGSGAFVVFVYRSFGDLKYHEASVEIVKAVESLNQKGI
jgi:ribonuclease P protein component